MNVKKEFVKPKTDYSVLMQDPYVVKWIDNYTSDQQSRLRVLCNFIEFIGKTPKELILEHHKDRSADPLEKTHIAKKQLKKYFNYLISDKLISKNAAIQYVYSKIMSFYARNDVEVKLNKGEKPTMEKRLKKRIIKDVDGNILRNKKEIFKNIRDILKSTRDRAILLCKLSTGADDVDLFNLTIQDFEDGKFPKQKICYVEGNRQKPQGNPRFQGFFNNEAFELIEMYLSERKQRGEKLLSKDKLFVSNHAVKGKEGVYRKIKAQAFAEVIRNATKTLGLKNITPKYFRSWFKTTLGLDKIPEDIICRLMGHSGKISMEYEQIFDDLEQFMEYYIEKINDLTTLGNGNAKYKKVSEEIEVLKNENKDLNLKLNDLITLVYRITDIVNKESDLHIELGLENLGKRPIEKPKKFDKDGQEIPL